MKKGLLIVLILAMAICTGCASKAVSDEPKPLAFIDGIELGMTKAEVQAAEGRVPDYVSEDGRYCAYNDCEFILAGYEAFSGRRGYSFDDKAILQAYSFSLDSFEEKSGFDPEMIEILLRKTYGEITSQIEEGDDHTQMWEFENFNAVHSYDEILELIIIEKPGLYNN